MIIPTYCRALAIPIAMLATQPTVSVANADSPSPTTPPVVFTEDDYPAFVFGRDDYVLLPDGDRVFLGDKALVFEAQVAPDVRLFSNMHAATERVLGMQTGDNCPNDGTPSKDRRCFKRHWGLSAFGTILIRLRMFKQDSNPVKTPSFMPKGTVQFIGFKSLLNPYAPVLDYPRSSVSVKAAIATLGHHSNGQDGCLFVVEDNEPCTSSPNARGERDINTDDGSFSTNYVRFGVVLGTDDYGGTATMRS